MWLDENGDPDLYTAHKCVYGGPAMNPTQIAEMLVGERERCAKICDGIATSISNEWQSTAYDPYNAAGDSAKEAAETCAEEIRNLGDAT